SLAAWLVQNGNPDCIDLIVGDECGIATGTITRNETNWDTWAVAFEEGTATYAGWTEGSINFPEDYNGGSVEVAYYLVGPEGDYGKISGEPNFWNQNAATITVDTDCEDPEPEPEPTTAVVTGECIPGGLNGVFGAHFRINYDLGEGVTLFVAGQSVTGEGIIHLEGAGTYPYTLEVEGE